VATVAAGYAGYALVRLAVRASRPAAIAHATLLWRSEQWLHLDIEPSVNHLAAARPVLAELAGYYYGLAHFIVTPLVLAWLWLRRPAAFGPLRSALVLATTGANVVFWAWPVAPPRFAVPGMTDVLVRYRILGAGTPHRPDSLVNLYAAMPSLHVAWAVWCTAAVVTATRGRWRHLAWLYPAATTVVVLATANHFLAAAAGLAITALGLLAARARSRPDATEPAAGHPKSSPRNRENAGATQARLGMTGQARAFIAALGDEQASSGEIRNASAVICLAEGDPAGALAEVTDVVDGTTPVTGDVTVMEAYLLAGLAHRELGDQRAANQAAERAQALAEPDRLGYCGTCRPTCPGPRSPPRCPSRRTPSTRTSAASTPSSPSGTALPPSSAPASCGCWPPPAGHASPAVTGSW
jgi:hypothetical protein